MRDKKKYRVVMTDGYVAEFETTYENIKSATKRNCPIYSSSTIFKWATDIVFEVYYRGNVIDVGIVYDLSSFPSRQHALMDDIMVHAELQLKHGRELYGEININRDDVDIDENQSEEITVIPINELMEKHD